MSTTKWHKGPPPSVGWWPASVQRGYGALRWWDGKRWSVACFCGADDSTVREMAAIKAAKRPPVEWTYRPAWWPKRSLT